MEKIIELIANYFGFEYGDLIEKSNKVKVSNARNYAYYILHYDYGYSANKIAKHFGRTRGTVFAQIADIKYLIKNIKIYSKEYTSVMNAINNEPTTD